MPAVTVAGDPRAGRQPLTHTWKSVGTHVLTPGRCRGKSGSLIPSVSQITMALPPQTLGSFAVAADVFTMLVLLAPWLTAVPAIYKSREVGRRSPLPNIAAVLSCCVGLLYGCSRRDGLVIGVNVAGAVMQAGYVGVFVYFSPAWRLVLVQCAVATVTYAALICFYVFGLIDAGGLAYAAGACACLVSIAILYNMASYYKLDHDSINAYVLHSMWFVTCIRAWWCSPR
ncbi:hypothetical protein D1007_42806 [Hordeum vulgare]|nr:hypothetical protein D1007_42806 [Hordeum vulgare]